MVCLFLKIQFLICVEEPATEWITADKKKLKKPTSPPITERGGGRGRGRSAPPGRGEGGRGGRGPGGRSSSVNTSGGRGRGGGPKVETAPSAELEKKVESAEIVEEKSETFEEKSEPVVESPAPPAVKTAKSSYSAPVWGAGMSLAQKLREQESAPLPPASAPIAEEPTVEVAPVSQEAPVSTAFAGQSKRVSSSDYSFVVSFPNFSHHAERMPVVVVEEDAHIEITHMLVQNLKIVMPLQNQWGKNQMLRSLRMKSKMCP